MSKNIALTFIAVMTAIPLFACQIKVRITDWTAIEDMQKRLVLVSQNGKEEDLKVTLDECSFSQPAAGTVLIFFFEGYRYKIPFRNDLCDSLQSFSVQPLFATSAEIVFTGHREMASGKNIASPVALITAKQIKSTDSFSLLPAMNTVAGVSMESRGFGGSHRLSIRGSALRSPFAVRNIKMYIDGIPMTSPDGQTPLELIDAADIGRIEIIKGPASTIYGSGNGGVVLIETPRIKPGTSSSSVSLQAGSFGSFRNCVNASLGLKNGGFRVSHVWQDVVGFREQEGNHKNQFTITYQGFVSEKQRVMAYLTYFDGMWELPGALNAVQRDTMPTAANNYSKINGTKLQRERIHGGFGHRYRGEFFQEETVIYYTNTQKENPFGTSALNSGFKQEWADGFGGRTDMSAKWRLGINQIKVKAGGEWQSEKYSIIENTIAQGVSGDLKYTYDVGYLQSSLYLLNEVNIGDIISLQGGLNKGFTRQNIKGFTSEKFEFDTTLTIPRQWLPRASLSISLNEQWQLYQSYSEGNSLPTIFEAVDYENNVYNLSLRPESGINNEYGMRYSSASRGIDMEVGYYNFRLKDAILSYRNDKDVTLYHNAGETLQRGIEWNFRYHFQNKKLPNTRYSEITLWTTGSYFNYTFLHYQVEDSDLSGNRIPGVPNAQINTGIQTEIHHASGKSITGFQLTHYQYLSQTLTNDNSVSTDPYSLLNLNLSQEISLNENSAKHPLRLRIFIGINNLLNISYTSFHQYNAVNGNFYNPSPIRNFYGGIQIHFNKYKQ